ncbi:MAG: ribbon-helix-helix domain-containing protein [Rhodospirillaceae bacterium]|nr:ribbon-helix-helix domain-containing protein [Rhodospirillaceae bacterium]
MKLSDSNIKKRSIIIDGHATSVSVENEFWLELKKISQTKKISLNALIQEIDHGRRGGLSSAIRLYVLAEVSKK